MTGQHPVLDPSVVKREVALAVKEKVISSGKMKIQVLHSKTQYTLSTEYEYTESSIVTHVIIPGSDRLAHLSENALNKKLRERFSLFERGGCLKTFIQDIAEEVIPNCILEARALQMQREKFRSRWYLFYYRLKLTSPGQTSPGAFLFAKIGLFYIMWQLF